MPLGRERGLGLDLENQLRRTRPAPARSPELVFDRSAAQTDLGQILALLRTALPALPSCDTHLWGLSYQLIKATDDLIDEFMNIGHRGVDSPYLFLVEPA
jgi:hypothetical protein